MIERRPRTTAELLGVSGVGPVKAARYGDAFLRALREAGPG
jgi:superfamily II DNA helicase RecQ